MRRSGTGQLMGALSGLMLALAGCALKDVPERVAPPASEVEDMTADPACAPSYELAGPYAAIDNRTYCAKGWRRTVGSVGHRRTFGAGTALADGRILLTGGWGGLTSYASAEVYDPTSDTFGLVAPMHSMRAMHQATRLQDGRVLVTGGRAWCADWEGKMHVVSSAEVYDPSSDTWTSAARMHHGRSLHASVLLPDGRVLVAGGDSHARDTSWTAEIYDPQRDAWTLTPPLPVELYGATAVPTAVGILFVGGESRAAALYEPITNSWRALTPRQGLVPGGVVGLADSRVLIVPSVRGTGVEVFSPEHGTWSQAGQLAESRYTANATLLDTGGVLTVGGHSYVQNSIPRWGAEVLDPTSGSWKPAGHMAVPRAANLVFPLSGGRALTVGGFSPEGDVGFGEVFDPALLAQEADKVCPKP